MKNYVDKVVKSAQEFDAMRKRINDESGRDAGVAASKVQLSAMLLEVAPGPEKTRARQRLNDARNEYDAARIRVGVKYNNPEEQYTWRRS